MNSAANNANQAPAGQSSADQTAAARRAAKNLGSKLSARKRVLDFKNTIDSQQQTIDGLNQRIDGQQQRIDGQQQTIDQLQLVRAGLLAQVHALDYHNHRVANENRLLRRPDQTVAELTARLAASRARAAQMAQVLANMGQGHLVPKDEEDEEDDEL